MSGTTITITSADPRCPYCGALKKLGLRPWDDSGLMLFPQEWYGLIPNGFETTDINGKLFKFERRDGADDCRYGVLAYGIYAARSTDGN